jgi:hypothetical protein
MGLDTVIYFQAKPDFDLDSFDCGFPNGFTVVPADNYLREEYPRVTHRLEGYPRFYGVGYERGPWPEISAALMILFATPGIEGVWYGHDCGGVVEIFPENVLEISEYYMRRGRRPYYGVTK